ncbi:universal stress protein [Aurantimonas sp. E1-2-R+4]|uniref:universal stress protein n=1 Tax=Aurantimonas sp. E1-2-R+4 TaxID=3113714 RepID=UPI002F94DC6A
MMKYVLCAIDGSRASQRAVDFAVGMAANFGAAVRFITVTAVTQASAAKSPFWDTRLFDAGETLIAREQTHAMEAAAAKGVTNASCATVNGRDVATAIVAYAQEHGFDHIVMGTSGHSVLERLLTGSVVDDVLNQPHPPVTVV